MKQSEENCRSCSDSSCAVKSAPKEAVDEKEQAEITLRRRLCGIDRKILVMSGKGGVGKSSTAVNLALALAAQGHAVGLLDVDIHGPSVPKMLGLEGEKPRMSEDGIVPVSAQGIKVMSIGFMLQSDDDAVIWRGAMKHGVIRQFIGEVVWGALDYLVIDCPPGTGDEPLSVAQTVGTVGAGAVIVTTPQDVAILDVRKSINFCNLLKLPILGIVENMSGFCCPGCGEVHNIFNEGGGEKLATEKGVPFLGAIPLDPMVVQAGDAGRPSLLQQPQGAVAKAFVRIAEQVGNSCRKAESAAG